MEESNTLKRNCKYCGKKLPFLIFRDAFGRDKDSCLKRCKKCGKCKTEDNPYCLSCNNCDKCLESYEGYKSTKFWNSILGIRWCNACYETAVKKHNDERLEKEEEKNRIKLEKENKLQQQIEEEFKVQENKISRYRLLRKQIEQMPIYERWRQDVINKCRNRCQMCGNNNNLEVHHRISLYLLLKQFNINSIEQAFENKHLWNIDNGEVLCKECHDKMGSSKNRQVFISKK
jgi:5-methylcytosine-specific restriction endonuclease McrA